MFRIRIIVALLGAIAAVPQAAAANQGWRAEAGIGLAAVDGVRPYTVPAAKLRQNDTPRVTARFLRVARELGDRWTVGLGYHRYGEMRGSGASPHSDVFDRSQVAFPVVVPLEITDRLREYSVDARWHWRPGPRLAAAVGPVVSLFASEAELGSSMIGTIGLNGPPQKVYSRITTFSATEWRAGLVTAFELALSRRWTLEIGYRYVRPPARELHLGSASLGWRL